MGGVGKTTLVKELIKFVENKLFDKVVMAVVSQNPDYKNIQSQIADCLGLSLKSESVEGRGREIIQRMKEIDDGKTKVLVVLDDVWSELNFDWVGLPSRDNQKCSKILFTSRHEKECQKMGSQVSFHVSVLLEDEAWYLFQEITGDVVYEPDIYPIAKQVSRECGGLPLAIVIVGKALENEKILTTWEVAFEQLKNSQSSTFSDVHKFVYSRIELSFKFLGSTEHKKLLMLCALFPEDFDIPIESLLRHAMGLGLFKVAGEPLKARNRVHSLVNDLKRCCLLLNSDVPGCVKMHDIVRDVVILVAYKTEHKFMVKYDMKSLKEEKLNDINAISLILDETICLEGDLEFPSLQLLQVQSNEKKLPEHFFRGMKSIKVLSVQKFYIPKIPSLCESSTSLHTLQVESCKCWRYLYNW
ncbi:CC-NBS-LRR resistance protein [Trifolium pratense]|uniref:CC-NBS-LRR resistance protein n=1 Tax=Trifolium pratense TaxID=57577 RepID=A0A2K3LWK9_TRIPR|nr:CC-NBS-LRR resistance protein [Trifolium pratense]